MLSYKTPGVYIEEIPATGPIAGVGTSTAAFLGPAQDGPIGVPTKITNFTEFKAQFGGYLTGPYFLAHAMRGFFDNGGTVAYVVRVGTAVRAYLDLADRKAGNALRVEALLEGPVGNTITVQVKDAQIVATATAAQAHRGRAAIVSATTSVLTFADAAAAGTFRPGEWIEFETGVKDRSQIDRVRLNQVFLTSSVTGTHAAGEFVRISDLAVGQRTFRVDKGAGIGPGSVLALTQGATTEDVVVDTVLSDTITLAAPGLTKTYGLTAAAVSVDITSYEFALVVTAGTVTETFDQLSMDPRHSRYFAREISSALISVALANPPGSAPAPANRPAVIVATPLAHGVADNLATLGLSNYQAALTALGTLDDVNLVCAPDLTTAAGQQAIIAHCEQLGDRFAILDAARGLAPFGGGSVIAQRQTLDSTRGYAALYYPWLSISDPASLSGDDTILVPPSGHLAGIYARSDAQRGVHKAPANELIVGALGLERIVDGATQGELNIEGVNVVRVFQGKARPVVWGARTTTPKDLTPWRYVNVRRLFIFVETSIQVGIQWAVFEPNDLSLWKKLDRTITEFLTRVWRSGALFGATAKEAFYVKIDAELNPPSVRALGQVIIEIGMAPVRPAEFVIVRIGMWDGGANVSEA